MFKRRTPSNLTNLMVEYINSILPDGMMCRETIGDSENSSLMVFNDTRAIKFEFEFESSYNVKELSDGDKLHLNRTVILPSLKALDKELFKLHKEIEAKIKELEKA